MVLENVMQEERRRIITKTKEQAKPKKLWQKGGKCDVIVQNVLYILWFSQSGTKSLLKKIENEGNQEKIGENWKETWENSRKNWGENEEFWRETRRRRFSPYKEVKKDQGLKVGRLYQPIYEAIEKPSYIRFAKERKKIELTGRKSGKTLRKGEEMLHRRK